MKTLRIEELSKNFGTTEVLRKINLEIDEGNFLVLLGPSGCGKSTLLNIIAGLETINEGNVLDSLRFSFSTGESFDSLMLFGTIVDALTLETKSGIRVFLQDTSVVDSLCFLTQPKHVTKTNNNGEFLFFGMNIYIRAIVHFGFAITKT